MLKKVIDVNIRHEIQKEIIRSFSSTAFLFTFEAYPANINGQISIITVLAAFNRFTEGSNPIIDSLWETYSKLGEDYK